MRRVQSRADLAPRSTGCSSQAMSQQKKEWTPPTVTPIDSVHVSLHGMKHMWSGALLRVPGADAKIFDLDFGQAQIFLATKPEAAKQFRNFCGIEEGQPWFTDRGSLFRHRR